MKKITILFLALAMVLMAGAQRSLNYRPAKTKGAANVGKGGFSKDQTIRTFPYREGFENGLGGWQTEDADNDSLTWTAVSDFGVEYEGHGVAASASYDVRRGELTPDNWLISPEIELPGNTAMSLVWMVSALDTLNYNENYTVYISTSSGSSILNFQTVLLTETLNDRGYACRTVDLSSYRGRTVRIAFRHHACTDQSALLIDGIRIHPSGSPVVAIGCPPFAQVGDTSLLEARLLSGDGLTSFAWQIDGIGNTTGSRVEARWDSAASYRIRLIGTYGSSRDTAWKTFRVIDCGRPLHIPFTETFDIGLGCWYLTDHRNDPERQHHVWLVSPEIAVPVSGDYELSWTVTPYEPLSNQATYEVYVSTQGNAVSDFTVPAYSETLEPTAESVRRVLPLAAWAGDTINIAIRYREIRGSEGLIVNSVSATAATAPQVELRMPVSARASQRVMLVAKVVSSLPVTSYRWNCQGISSPANNDTIYVQWPASAAGRNSVSITVQTAAGSATATGFIAISACEDYVSSFPYHEELDNALGCWEPLDGNGDGKCWESVRGMLERLDADSSLAEYFVRNGEDAAVSWSYYPYSYHNGFWGDAVLSDNYLVSPAMRLPEANNPMKLSFFARSYGAPAYIDSVEVKIATVKPQNAADFSRTIMPLTPVPEYEYRRIIVDLAEFAGQTIYIGILHHAIGGMALVVDDIEIAADFEGIEQAAATLINVYPNPTSGLITMSRMADRIEVLDASGRMVFTARQAASVDLSGMASGIYFLRIITDDGVSVKKVTKK